MVAKVRDVLDRSTPLLAPGFVRFLANPPAEAKAELDAFTARFAEALGATGPESALEDLANMYLESTGLPATLERDALRIAGARARPLRTQSKKLPRAKRTGRT